MKQRLMNIRKPFQVYYDIFIYGLIFICLVLLFITTIFFWPTPKLGLFVNPWTHQVDEIDPNGSADRAGIQVGDTVIHAYGDYSWDTLLDSFNILALRPPLSEPLPFTVERNGTYHTVQVWQQAPTLSFQLEKIIRFGLGFLCWLTGYTIAVVRRQHATKSALAALFWICLGVILGMLLFASYASTRLNIFLSWILMGFLAPICPFLFSKFTIINLEAENLTTQKAILILLVFVNGLIVLGFSLFPSRDMLWLFDGIAIYIWLLIFVITGIKIIKQYRKEKIQHIRRQYRIIASSCIMLGIIWAILSFIKNIIGYKSILLNYILEIAVSIIPISFLIIHITMDLYYIDRVARRAIGILITISILILGFQWINQSIPLIETSIATLIALYCIGVYYPVFKFVQWVVPMIRMEYYESHTVEQCIHTLTTSLDPTFLINTIVESINQTFGTPALSFYHAEPSNPSVLKLVYAQRIDDLPPMIQAEQMNVYFRQGLGKVVEGQRLFQAVKNTMIPLSDEGMLNHPRILLWCPILNAKKQLLGLITLGMRGDLDPYRRQDIRLIERLLDSSSLALANSATYILQKESEDLIRQLFQALKNSHDETASAIARELHDEIININVRVNIQSLEQVIMEITDSSLREELQLVLETEHNTAEALRMICERLQPTAIRDPYGLAALLRMQTQRIQPLWGGSCTLNVLNTPLPLPPQFQHEALRITREALMNVVKHATYATEVMIDLVYPENPSEDLCLTISDNGSKISSISPIRGHFGLHNMRESARAINGTITFQSPVSGGTSVILTVPIPDSTCHLLLEGIAA